MSLIRTRLSFERTLMSWVRTAMSLITFGFTLYQAYLHLKRNSSGGRGPPVEVYQFALVMLGIGILALPLAMVQYLRHVAVLRELDRELPIVSVALVMAVLFVVFSVWMVIHIFSRQ